jgi:hypothetical protein
MHHLLLPAHNTQPQWPWWMWISVTFNTLVSCLVLHGLQTSSPELLVVRKFIYDFHLLKNTESRPGAVAQWQSSCPACLRPGLHPYPWKTNKQKNPNLWLNKCSSKTRLKRNSFPTFSWRPLSCWGHRWPAQFQCGPCRAVFALLKGVHFLEEF